MILICSAAYISQDLQAIYGRIPPAFLPVQNKRLYVHQRELFEEEQVYLSLPSCYSITKDDEFLLKSLDISVIRVPSKLSLAESITFALLEAECLDESLEILFGDTYFTFISKQTKDIAYISKVRDYYNWALVEEDPFKEYVYAGYFKFTNPSKLLKSLNKNRVNFIDAVLTYKSISEENFTLKPAEGWHDFGHVTTYFKSKSLFTTERHFNQLSSTTHTFTKLSSERNKMLAETQWYCTLPDSLKLHTPQFLGIVEEDGSSGYELEYLHLPTLNELFVFGELPIFLWGNILNSCMTFLNKVNHHEQSELDDVYWDGFHNKTMLRLIKAKEQGIVIDKPLTLNGVSLPSLIEISSELTLTKDELSETKSRIHGDFCFSNILYDQRSQLIRVIDPRGIDFEGSLDCTGSVLYDISKLAHSVIGLYDMIIADRYKLNYTNNGTKFQFEIFRTSKQKQVQDLFLEMEFNGFRVNNAVVIKIVIHLFLSMLPLHKDSPKRQLAFVANALRLYKSYKNSFKI